MPWWRPGSPPAWSSPPTAAWPATAICPPTCPARAAFLTVDHGPRAPMAARPDMFELAERAIRAATTTGRRRSAGATSWARWRRRCRAPWPASAPPTPRPAGCRWRPMLEPAIELADEGVEFDWHIALMILERLDDIRAMPAAAAQLLRDGDPPHGSGYWGGGERLDTAALAATLRRIADAGPGRLPRRRRWRDAIDRAVAEGGGIITAADVAGYRPEAVSGAAAALPRRRVRHLERPGRLRGAEHPRAVLVGAAMGAGRRPLPARARRGLRLRLRRQRHPLRRRRAHRQPAGGAGLAGVRRALRAAAIRPDAVLARPIRPADPWPFQPGGAAGAEPAPQVGGSGRHLAR